LVEGIEGGSAAEWDQRLLAEPATYLDPSSLFKELTEKKDIISMVYNPFMSSERAWKEGGGR
jgi:hypothetical protein